MEEETKFQKVDYATTDEIEPKEDEEDEGKEQQKLLNAQVETERFTWFSSDHPLEKPLLDIEDISDIIVYQDSSILHPESNLGSEEPISVKLRSPKLIKLSKKKSEVVKKEPVIPVVLVPIRRSIDVTASAATNEFACVEHTGFHRLNVESGKLIDLQLNSITRKLEPDHSDPLYLKNNLTHGMSAVKFERVRLEGMEEYDSFLHCITYYEGYWRPGKHADNLRLTHHLREQLVSRLIQLCFGFSTKEERDIPWVILTSSAGRSNERRYTTVGRDLKVRFTSQCIKPKSQYSAATSASSITCIQQRPEQVEKSPNNPWGLYETYNKALACLLSAKVYSILAPSVAFDSMTFATDCFRYFMKMYLPTTKIPEDFLIALYSELRGVPITVYGLDCFTNTLNKTKLSHTEPLSVNQSVNAHLYLVYNDYMVELLEPVIREKSVNHVFTIQEIQSSSSIWRSVGNVANKQGCCLEAASTGQPKARLWGKTASLDVLCNSLGYTPAKVKCDVCELRNLNKMKRNQNKSSSYHIPSPFSEQNTSTKTEMRVNITLSSSLHSSPPSPQFSSPEPETEVTFPPSKAWKRMLHKSSTPLTLVWNYAWHVNQSIITFYIRSCKNLETFQEQVTSSVDRNPGSVISPPKQAAESIMKGIGISWGGILNNSLVTDAFSMIHNLTQLTGKSQRIRPRKCIRFKEDWRNVQLYASALKAGILWALRDRLLLLSPFRFREGVQPFPPTKSSCLFVRGNLAIHHLKDIKSYWDLVQPRTHDWYKEVLPKQKVDPSETQLGTPPSVFRTKDCHLVFTPSIVNETREYLTSHWVDATNGSMVACNDFSLLGNLSLKVYVLSQILKIFPTEDRVLTRMLPIASENINVSGFYPKTWKRKVATLQVTLKNTHNDDSEGSGESYEEEEEEESRFLVSSSSSNDDDISQPPVTNGLSDVETEALLDILCMENTCVYTLDLANYQFSLPTNKYNHGPKVHSSSALHLWEKLIIKEREDLGVSKTRLNVTVQLPLNVDALAYYHAPGYGFELDENEIQREVPIKKYTRIQKNLASTLPLENDNSHSQQQKSQIVYDKEVLFNHLLEDENDIFHWKPTPPRGSTPFSSKMIGFKRAYSDVPLVLNMNWPLSQAVKEETNESDNNSDTDDDAHDSNATRGCEGNLLNFGDNCGVIYIICTKSQLPTDVLSEDTYSLYENRVREKFAHQILEHMSNDTIPSPISTTRV